MPRLSDPTITKGNARWALLKLYRNDPYFMKEFNELRSPYMGLLDGFAVDVLAFFLREDTPSDLSKALFDYWTGKSKDNPLPPEQFYQLFPYFDQLQPYFDGLRDLACRWKLTAPWAVHVLFFFDMVDYWRARGMPDEVEMPLEKFDSLFPWEPLAAPLTITVPAWAIILLGRQRVLKEIARRLEQYEKELKTSGLKEYPSALETHASWWFEHYVKGLDWGQIADKIAKVAPGGGPQPENIRKAVNQFSKLIGVQPEDK